MKMTNEKFTFFWKSPLSQWHYSKFIVDEIEYCTAEQYMMAGKARLFDDVGVLNKIMNCISPREQKEWGRLVKGFDKLLETLYLMAMLQNFLKMKA